MIIFIRTEQPEAEVSLFDTNGQQIESYKWQAHRELSATLLTKLKELLGRHDKDFKDLTGVVVFEGPGSFTGLRIGITVANTLAYGLGVAVVGARGDDWKASGLEKLKSGQNTKIVLPHYGAEAHITPPHK